MNDLIHHFCHRVDLGFTAGNLRGVSRLGSGVVLMAVAIIAPGCRTPPNLAPFADATSQLAGSIKTTGRVVAGEIKVMAHDWPEDQRKAAEKIANQFNVAWADRNALANALVDYSSSLTAIAQAGEQGQKSAQQVADAFSKLCSSIDVALPAGAAVDSAIRIGTSLYGRFAQNYAAKTLGEGMKKLQPAIDETAIELSRSLENVETALDAIREQIDDNVEAEEIDGVKVATMRNHAAHLAGRKATLVEVLLTGAEARDGLRRDLLSTTLSSEERDAREKKLTRQNSLMAEIAAELASVEASLASHTAKLAPVDARIAADRSRLTTQIELVRAVRGGLSDWAAAHSRLAAAALDRQPLQVNDLVQTALEIQELVNTVRHQPAR